MAFFNLLVKYACGKHNLTILLHFVLQCKLHTLTAQMFLSSYLLKTYVFKHEYNCFTFLVLGMGVCNSCCRTKRKSFIKLCLPQSLLYS